MKLWNIWFDLVKPFEACCKREATFFWLVITLIGFTVKTDFFGVTSLVRGVGLLPNYYTCALHFFNSSGVSLSQLLTQWVQWVFSHFSGLVKINNRYILVADGIKIGKEGKKMPGVKWLHQESDSNSKAEHIMGHSLQAVAVLAKGIKSFFAVPLTAKIHEGIRADADDKTTLLDKLLKLLLDIEFPALYYLVADKYYCSGRLMKQLIAKNIHLVTAMKKNAVAYFAPLKKTSSRGRSKKYGEKVTLLSLFDRELNFSQAPMPNDPKTIIQYASIDLLWKPLGRFARFVFVKHPKRGNKVFMTTDLSLKPLDVILVYGLRFKIEVVFKQAIHQMGTFMYRFWLRAMPLRKRGKDSGDYIIKNESEQFKEKLEKKMNAYHLFIQLGFIAQGLTQYLSVYYHSSIWESFGSWLRTVRDKTFPSEKVACMTLARTYLPFLIAQQKSSPFAKFLWQRSQLKEFFDMTG